MKIALIALCLAVAVVADEDKYDADIGFDASEVLSNDRLLKSYSKCLLDKGPCTPEIKKVKEKLPEALETRCAKCTEKQKNMGKQLVQALEKDHPEIWKELKLHYDPEGKYAEALNDFLKP